MSEFIAVVECPCVRTVPRVSCVGTVCVAHDLRAFFYIEIGCSFINHDVCVSDCGDRAARPRAAQPEPRVKSAPHSYLHFAHLETD